MSTGTPTKSQVEAGHRDTIPQNAYQGWKQFELDCARCHGEYGAGSTSAPALIVSLKDGGTVPDQAAFITVVCQGRPDKGMPSWCQLGLEIRKIQNINAYPEASRRRQGGRRPAGREGGRLKDSMRCAVATAALLVLTTAATAQAPAPHGRPGGGPTRPVDGRRAGQLCRRRPERTVCSRVSTSSVPSSPARSSPARSSPAPISSAATSPYAVLEGADLKKANLYGTHAPAGQPVEGRPAGGQPLRHDHRECQPQRCRPA